MANALAPFVQEPLRSRTRARPGQRRFRISDLDRRPTTFFLCCPLRDLEAAQRVGSVATSLLLAHIYERRPPAAGQPDPRIPMLLLLDETRLLSTNLAEFLAVGRGFKAGVVTCYQELDQIRDEATRREIVTNSTTLICLRGIGPGSRKSLLERLAHATVQVAGVGASLGEEAHQQANVSLTRQEVAVLGEYEIRALPGPKYAALVHIQDGTVPHAKPFLVDLTNYPYVLGGLWNGKDAPPSKSSQIISGGNVNQRIIRSRTGHIVTLDDSDSQPSITIVDNTGKNTIKLDSKNNKLTVHLEGDLLFEATQGDISLKAKTFHVEASDALSLQGNSVDVKSNTDISIKATNDVSLEAESNLSVKGLTAEIQGSTKLSLDGGTATEVKGAMIKIG